MGMEVHCSEKQRHGSASTRTAAEWHCCAQQGYGIALRREASEKTVTRRMGMDTLRNGYEMQATAIAPRKNATPAHSCKKRRPGKETKGAGDI